MQKKSYNLLCLISLLLVASCASIPDEPVCAEVSISKGICTYTVSKKEIVVDDNNLLNGETWFEVRRKALTVPAKSWASFRAYLIKMCKKYSCTEDVSSWDREIN